MKQNRRFLTGFTLIELLLVIVILGILVVIALSVINPVRLQRRAREAAMKSQASKVCAALFACAAASQTLAECNTLALLGVSNVTNGTPLNSTYVLSAADPVTFTATMAGGGGKTATSCIYTCTYNFGTGASTGVLPSVAANCY